MGGDEVNASNCGDIGAGGFGASADPTSVASGTRASVALDSAARTGPPNGSPSDETSSLASNSALCVCFPDDGGGTTRVDEFERKRRGSPRGHLR